MIRPHSRVSLYFFCPSFPLDSVPDPNGFFFHESVTSHVCSSESFWVTRKGFKGGRTVVARQLVVQVQVQAFSDFCWVCTRCVSGYCHLSAWAYCPSCLRMGEWTGFLSVGWPLTSPQDGSIKPDQRSPCFSDSLFSRYGNELTNPLESNVSLTVYELKKKHFFLPAGTGSSHGWSCSVQLEQSPGWREFHRQSAQVLAETKVVE